MAAGFFGTHVVVHTTGKSACLSLKLADRHNDWLDFFPVVDNSKCMFLYLLLTLLADLERAMFYND